MKFKNLLKKQLPRMKNVKIFRIMFLVFTNLFPPKITIGRNRFHTAKYSKYMLHTASLLDIDGVWVVCKRWHIGSVLNNRMKIILIYADADVVDHANLGFAIATLPKISLVIEFLFNKEIVIDNKHNKKRWLRDLESEGFINKRSQKIKKIVKNQKLTRGYVEVARAQYDHEPYDVYFDEPIDPETALIIISKNVDLKNCNNFDEYIEQIANNVKVIYINRMSSNLFDILLDVKSLLKIYSSQNECFVKIINCLIQYNCKFKIVEVHENITSN